jgi:sugar/nucleoside kinase (ribokinase family)
MIPTKLRRRRRREELLMHDQPPRSAPRIVSVGNFVVDTIVRPVAALPRPGELGLVDEISVAGGGAGFTTSVALARLGAAVVAVGAVGNDRAGGDIRRWLAADGVETAHLQVVDAPTSATVVVVAPSGERTYLHAPGASNQMRLDPRTAELPGLTGIHIGAALILPGLDVSEGGVRTIRAARERGILTSLDTSWDSTGRWARVLPYLPFLDVFTPSLVEARQISGQIEAERVADWIVARGTRMAVIHDGARGAYVASADFTGWVPACAVEVVDTTGAGECFDAGLVFGLCSGWPVVNAVRLACATGALAATCPGAVGGVVSLEAALATAGMERGNQRRASIAALRASRK